MGQKLAKGTVVTGKGGKVIKTVGESSTKKTSSGRDYSSSSDPQVEAINKAKAEEIGQRKAGTSTSTRDVDTMFKLPESPVIQEPQIPEAPGPVNTSQPSPSGATEMMQQNQPGAEILSPYQRQGQDMASRYQQGFNTMSQSGTPVPQTQGQAASAITSAIPQKNEDMSGIDTMLQEDAGFQSLQQMYTDYFNPDNQKTSLVKEYKKLYKNSGLDELDEEIVDAQTVIEGTEDDIRNEIQAAGGFGTDSQVQALASSRNKVLLKNYNNLVAMREMKQKNFDTMLSLTEKDRAYADSKAEQMLNFQFKVMDYKNKFVENTRSQLNNIANKLGYQALYDAYSKDPRQLAFAEQILGVGTGGLQELASQLDLDRELKMEQIATEKAQRSNIYSQISERNNPTVNSKPLSGDAAKVVGIANTLIPELETLKAKFNEDFKGTIRKIKLGTDPELMKLVENAADKVGRLRSGGAVNPDEEKRFKKQIVSGLDYWFGSSEKTGKAIDGLITEAQTVLNGVESGIDSARNTSSGGNITIGPDGNEYEIID